MFSFLTKGKIVTDLSWIQVDIHSHVLPAIDDGSPDIDTSVDFIKRLYALGLTASYATPHIFTEMYPNNAETINAALSTLQTALAFTLPEFRLAAAAEYMIDADFARLYERDRLMALPGNHILIEMPYAAENTAIDQHLASLRGKGYTPILAHPERYAFYHQQPDRYLHFKNQGCLFQLNLLSPSGYYGAAVRKAADLLLKRGMVDLVGTDLHHAKHMAAIEQFVLSGHAHTIFKKNAIKNEELFGA